MEKIDLSSAYCRFNIKNKKSHRRALKTIKSFKKSKKDN